MPSKAYCHFCAQPLVRRFVEGRDRLFCKACERPIYENPIPATCLVVTQAENRLLLVKRSVEPKKGYWCLPGGFIELGESPEQGALRELMEETGLRGRNERLLGVRTTPSRQYQSVLMIGFSVQDFSGQLVAGDDADETRWFAYDALPEIAFESHLFFIEQVFGHRRFPPS